MVDPYFLTILMRERERQIQEELGRGGHHAPGRRGGCGVSKKIAGWLRATFLRSKAIANPRQGRQRATNGKGGYESWHKEFS